MNRRQRTGFYILVILVSLVVVFPFVIMLSYSFRTSTDIFSLDTGIIPAHPTLHAYGSALFNYSIAGYGVFTWGINSIVVCGVATIAAIYISALAGFGISRYRFRGRNLLWFLIILTQLVPWIAVLIPYYSLLVQLHLLDSLASLGFTYMTLFTPVCAWLFIGFFQGMPVEIEEAARIDGCSQLGVFHRIVLPLATPGISAVALFAFVIGWGDFLMASVIIRSPQNWTLPLGLVSFRGEHRILWAESMAVASLITIPIVALFLYLQRNLINLMTGGVKG
ncbi:MAG TPA: carbohydrate ABC transporter permease [Spirochaetia bacterium]|nr:carbohydrate ABC transporter permease [Spirochaetia bacterium]